MPFSFLDAAAEVLRGANEPLSAKSITDIAIAKGFLKTAGKTPARTMGAALYVEAKNPRSRFVRLAKRGPHIAVRGTVLWRLRRSAVNDGTRE